MGRAAEAALEHAWGLGDELGPNDVPPAHKAKAPTPPPPPRSAEDLAAAKSRFAEMMREMSETNADDLTMMLNDAYRTANNKAKEAKDSA